MTERVSLRPTATRMTKRDWRSTRVAIWLLLLPASRSPSQWPGIARSAASAGRSRIETAPRICPWPRLPRRALLGLRTEPARRRCSSSSRFRAAGLDEQGQVDRLVRHPHSLVLGVVRPQPTGDLLGRPVGGQLRGHERRQGRLTRELAVLRSPATLPGSPLCLGGTVAASAAVAVELARDRRRRSSEPGRDRPRRSAGGDAARDLLPLGQCQGKPAAPPLGRRQTATLPDLRIDRPGPRSSARPISLTDSPRRQRSHSSWRSSAEYHLRLLATATPPSSTAAQCCDEGLRAPAVTWKRQRAELHDREV